MVDDGWLCVFQIINVSLILTFEPWMEHWLLQEEDFFRRHDDGCHKEKERHCNWRSMPTGWRLRRWSWRTRTSLSAAMSLRSNGIWCRCRYWFGMHERKVRCPASKILNRYTVYCDSMTHFDTRFRDVAEWLQEKYMPSIERYLKVVSDCLKCKSRAKALIGRTWDKSSSAHSFPRRGGKIRNSDFCW